MSRSLDRTIANDGSVCPSVRTSIRLSHSQATPMTIQCIETHFAT